MEMNNLVAVFINGFYALINLLIEGVALILPSFSIADYLSGAFEHFDEFLGAINYFIPFGVMVDIAFAWVSAAQLDEAQNELHHIPDQYSRNPSKGNIDHDSEGTKIVYCTEEFTELIKCPGKIIGNRKRGKNKGNTFDQ